LISSEVFAKIKKLPIKQLTLANCNRYTLKDDDLKDLPKTLEKLDLSRNNWVTGKGLAHLENLPILSELNLSNIRFLKDTDLAKLPRSLVNLDLSDNNKLGGLENVKQLPQLYTLNLTRVGLNNNDLANLPQTLGKLNLRGNPWLTQAGIEHLKKLPQLIDLDLSANDSGLNGNALKGLPQTIEKLDVS